MIIIIYDARYELHEYARTSNEIIEFWEKQGYKIVKTTNGIITGKRGHIIHNYYTFNMKKLDTKITIRYESEALIHIEVDVNTIGQMILKEEAAIWVLEFDMFQAFLRKEDFNEENIRLYKKKKNKAVIKAIILIAIVVGILTIITLNNFFTFK